MHDAGHTSRDNTFFDHQRRYDGNRRARHVTVETAVNEDSDYHEDSSSENLYGSAVSDRGEGNDETDGTAYAEPQENTQDRVSHKPKMGCKTHKQAKDSSAGAEDEVKNRGNIKKNPVNYYEKLGIQQGASDVEIRKAAKKMRVQVHPQRLITPETSKEERKKIDQRAIEVGEAAETLLDRFSRQRYDQELQQRHWDNSR